MAHVPVSTGVLDSIQVTPDPLTKAASLALPSGVLALLGESQGSTGLAQWCHHRQRLCPDPSCTVRLQQFQPQVLTAKVGRFWSLPEVTRLGFCGGSSQGG